MHASCPRSHRYARTQFLSPFKEGYKKKTAFYNKKGASDSEGDSSDGEDPYVYDMDGDHRYCRPSQGMLCCQITGG